MKLRIKGDSLRLRIAPSEMAHLLETGRVEDTIHFGAGRDQRLIYALEHAADAGSVNVRHDAGRVTVVLPSEQAREWARGDAVGVYGTVDVGTVRLDVAVEKDWSCLDKSEAENRDTFANPNQGAKC